LTHPVGVVVGALKDPAMVVTGPPDKTAALLLTQLNPDGLQSAPKLKKSVIGILAAAK